MPEGKLTAKQREQLKRFTENKKLYSQERRKKLKDLLKKKGMPDSADRFKDLLKKKGTPMFPEIIKRMRKKKKDKGVISFGELKAMQDKKKKPRVMEAKKGGSAKFPDLSGDGKVTQKDILMGRGVIKRKKGGPAAARPLRKSSITDTAKKVIESLKKKRKINPDILRKKPKVRDLLYRPKYDKDGNIIKPKPSDLLYRPKYDKEGNIIKPKAVPMKRTKQKMMATGGVAGRLAKRGYGKARS